MHDSKSATEISPTPENQNNSQDHLQGLVVRLEERLNEMEIKLSFQDDLLNTLNDIVTRQDREILKLWDANRLLKQSMMDLREGSKEAIVDVPPPHY